MGEETLADGNNLPPKPTLLASFEEQENVLDKEGSGVESVKVELKESQIEKPLSRVNKQSCCKCFIF